MVVRIVEHHIVGKAGDPASSEDAIVVTDRYVAVIDGATSKVAGRPAEVSPGRRIAKAIAQFLESETRPLFGEELVRELTDHVRSVVLGKAGANRPDRDTPSAAIAVFTGGVNRITALGDVMCLINGRQVFSGDSRVDRFLAEARALFTRLLMAEGASVESLRRDDPGRRAIMPFLQKQHLLRNAPAFGEWAYGAVDGLSFHPALVRTECAFDGDEIVFCTDGYPRALPSLIEAERALEQALMDDPLRIGPFAGTKGLRLDDVSFDDRAYVRFVVGEE